MPELGLLILGAFVGYIVTYGLVSVEDWSKPGATLTGILSATVAGGLFTLIDQHAGEGGIGPAIFYYPVGLGYGALCTNLKWLTDEKGPRWLQIMHFIAFAFVSAALVVMMIIGPLHPLLFG